MDPDDWEVPDHNIVYSRGAPTGRTLSGREVFFDVMVNAAGEKVPCTESHTVTAEIDAPPRFGNLVMAHIFWSELMCRQCIGRFFNCIYHQGLNPRTQEVQNRGTVHVFASHHTY
jgi:hypothetical protein